MAQLLKDKRLTKFGRNSLCIILPKGVVDFYNLKGGDKIDLIVNDDLIIKLKTIKKKK